MDRAWQATVHRVAESPTRLSDLHFHLCAKQYFSPREITTLAATTYMELVECQAVV